MPRSPALASVALLSLAALACSSRAPEVDAGKPAPSASASTSPTLAGATAAALASASAAPEPLDAGAIADAGAEAGVVSGDPMANHLETKEALLALFSIKRPPKRDSNADGFLNKSFGVTAPSLINQGNKAMAKHAISKEACLAGLSGITLQTEEQKHICGGEENMVPISKPGKHPKVCIDIFEFPNKACELPVVWVAPVQAKVICELQGKRLCNQEEWTQACKGDPDGGKDRKFAYGDEMDLAICNTNKRAKDFGPGCEPDSASSAWRTCSTNTEPSGSFPQCRSRYGVFDQHGNVAEIMWRRDPDGHIYDQLKGSAFFYVDVARKPDARGKKETYPDHCAYDPRWHVEKMSEAWHVNYHLGFRCCKSVKKGDD